MDQQAPVIACSLTERELAVRLHELTQTLFSNAIDIAEHDDGYTLRFDGTPANAQHLANFVLEERQCCPFFRFSLQFEPNSGPITLMLGGDAAIKGFTQTLLAGHGQATSAGKNGA